VHWSEEYCLTNCVCVVAVCTRRLSAGELDWVRAVEVVLPIVVDCVYDNSFTLTFPRVHAEVVVHTARGNRIIGNCLLRNGEAQAALAGGVFGIVLAAVYDMRSDI